MPSEAERYQIVDVSPLLLKLSLTEHTADQCPFAVYDPIWARTDHDGERCQYAIHRHAALWDGLEHLLVDTVTDLQRRIKELKEEV